MIVFDTTVLMYAVGADHSLRAPSQRLTEAVDRRSIAATTTPQVIQEFAHVYGRRRPRDAAVRIARDHASLLWPLLDSTAGDLLDGLALFAQHPGLGAFDAVLAATAIANNADALVSADRAFDEVPGLRWLDPGSAVEQLLAGSPEPGQPG